MDRELVHFLVREARPGDRAAAATLLEDAGWSRAQFDAWNAGLPALVLCDPADGTIHGAVMARRREAGRFDLEAWAVAETADAPTVASRLVRAMADRVRREGGERLIVTVYDDAAGALLEASGFQQVDALTYHLQL